MTMVTDRSALPWYREPWPWLLMAGPFIVIVASLVTAWLALKSSDGLVAEDYYKQGLAAGETLSRSRHAEEMGLRAGIKLLEKGMQVKLSGHQSGMQVPRALLVNLSHPTRAGMDQQARLVFDGQVFTGAINLPASGHWLILIEDEAKTWRLMGSLVLPFANESVIGGGDAAGKLKL